MPRTAHPPGRTSKPAAPSAQAVAFGDSPSPEFLRDVHPYDPLPFLPNAAYTVHACRVTHGRIINLKAARVKAIFCPRGPPEVARPYKGDQLAGRSNRAGTRLRRAAGTPAAFACQQQPPGPPCGQTPAGRAGSDCLSVAQTLPCSCMSAAMPRAPGRRRSGRRGGRSSGPRRRCRRRCSCRSRRYPSRRPRRDAGPWYRRT